MAEEVNVGGSWNVAHYATQFGQRVIYASTVSVYGKVSSGACTEETETQPLSQYGYTKLQAEREFTQYSKGNTALRFPTLFGVAPRMRTDLMVNDLTYQAVKNGGAVVFEPDARRTFLHVRDAVRAIETAINRHLSGVYIPGDESLNVSKKELAAIIAKETGAKFHYAPIGHDGDARDYEVSFEKIKKLGYRTSVSLEEGVREVAQAARAMNVRNPYTNV
jgi:nucleoside-diphosphate-sugar epimerase